MLAIFSVTNIGDAGTGSLRQAILDANSLAGADTIEFDNVPFGTPQTINLGSALPAIAEDLAINGTGQNLITLKAGNGTDNLPGTGDGYRVFNIDDGNPNNILEVTISGLTLTGGDVAGNGGAIYSRENLTVTNSTITANTTGPGTTGIDGGVGQNGGGGGRGHDGGGIFTSGGDLTVISSTISGNTTGRGGNGGNGGNGAEGANGEDGGNGGDGGSGGYGGGIFSDGGNLDIMNSTISGNSTGVGGLSGSGGRGGEPNVSGIGGRGGDGGDGGYGGDGGGIYSSVGEVSISGSTISGNFTGDGMDGDNGADGGLGALGGNGGDGGDGGSGGALYSIEGRLEISRSTITNNWVGSRGNGGGSGSGGISGNDGFEGNGGGIDSLGNDPVLIDNTIVAANSAIGKAPDLRTGSVTLNVDYSLLGEGDGLVISNGTGNQVGTGLAPISPQLGPLADNGGRTRTHAPLAASPTIDAGDPGILFNAAEFDQRGTSFVRVEDGNFVAGSVIDIGAYEAQAPPLADFDQDSDVDGADFLRWQRGFGTTSGALLADGNSDDDDDVDSSDLAVWQASYGEPSSTFQSQRAEPPLAVEEQLTPPTGLALTSIDNAESGKRKAELSEPELISPEIYAIAFAELASTTDWIAPHGGRASALPPAAEQVVGIEAELLDDLLSIRF